MEQKQAGNNKNGRVLVWVIVGTVLVLGAVCLVVPSLISHKVRISAGEGHPAAALKTYNGMMATWQKKGYADIGRIYPHGTGGPSTNRGKYCGLYYEVNNAGERVTLIGVSDAIADCRADGDTDADEGQGFYFPAITTNGRIQYLPKVTFTCGPKQGAWFGLCIYMGTAPYNTTAAKSHYGMVCFPDDYGVSGETTFIINEEGTIYCRDRGKDGKYLDTYPADPVKEGWEVAR